MAGYESENRFKKSFNNKYPGLTQETEGRWKGPFCFIQSADTQLGLIDSWNEVAEEEQTWDKEIILTKKAIAAANILTPKPRFFIVCGDLVNAVPTHRYNDQQVADFKKVFQELDPAIPLICVCGNHDVGDSPTHKSVQKYRSNFGDDYFTFWTGGVFFIVINSQYFKDGSQVEDITKQQEDWLDEQLQLAKTVNAKHIVVFQHIPWFLKNVDEEDDYFNINKDVRKKMLQKLKKAGVKYVFAGHYHRNAGGIYDGDVEMVVTSAIGLQISHDKDSGMRIVSVLEDKISHEYYELDKVPKMIDL
ncbi:serine/threonine-protein phosphatase CPPED1 [Exaiptasia diaphana]|uniref:Serine/threonine-protein phosphatase CPPED1 n=1 Tax=Exaiptasia diaphana TaxID=2652724 RepID=A0A913X6X3_EXADI|nr:serine/threonine-protein phosphatase CPPED1 [Exaiptasia diaphana]KXJ14636.1 Serine/threonine-protein phosphatase CPPED1 [Exaiptasia diaphana]